MNKTVLIDFGMTSKEAIVYLTLLELGTATIQTIARKTEINRSSLYVILQKMEKLGFVMQGRNKIKQEYLAAEPETIKKIAEQKYKKSLSILTDIESIVPDLKALHKDTNRKPRVKIFSGIQGLKSAFEDTFSTKEKLIRICSSGTDIMKILPDFLPQYIYKRRVAGIKMRGIHPALKRDLELVRSVGDDIDENVLLPKQQYKIPADLAIYDDKVAYMSFENGHIAIVIESKEMAEVMKSVFDLAYEEAKRVSAKNSGK